MPKETPHISREHEQYAEKALADKIRSGTLQSVHLLDEMLWAGRSALTVLPRKDGDKIGWKSGYPLRLRANPGKTEEVNAIKEGASIKITGRPNHAIDKGGDHWWYPVEVSGGDLRDPKSANIGWVSAEFIQAELPSAPVPVPPPVENKQNKEVKNDTVKDEGKDAGRAPDDAVRVKKNRPSGRAPEDATREKRRGSAGRAPDDAIPERRASPGRAPDDNNKNLSRPTILPLPPQPSGRPDRLAVPGKGSGTPGVPTPPNGPSGTPSALNIPGKNSGPTQPLDEPVEPSGHPERLAIPGINSGNPPSLTLPKGPSGTPEQINKIGGSSGLPPGLDISRSSSGTAQPLKTPTGPSGSAKPLNPPSSVPLAPEKITAPSTPALSRGNNLSSEKPLTLDEKNFVGFNKELLRLVPKIEERNKIIRFIQDNPDLPIKNTKISYLYGLWATIETGNEAIGTINEISFQDGKCKIPTEGPQECRSIVLEGDSLIIKTENLISTKLYIYSK